MTNSIKKLLKGKNKGCCNIKIEEVKKENPNKELSNTNVTNDTNSCC